MITLRRENLQVALMEAIRVRREHERSIGYQSDSALVAGWQQVLDAMRRGEHVEVRA